MTPSPTLLTSSRRTSAVTRRRRRRNAPSGRPPPRTTARALAAGLWRLRHAERQAVRPTAQRHNATPSIRHQWKAHLCCGNKPRTDFGVRTRCRNHGILEKIEACVGMPCGAMEKATKWDFRYLHCLGEIFGSHDPLKNQGVHHARATSLPLVVLEAELEKARAHISELEDDKVMTRKKLERFLRQLTEEKASWKNRMRQKAQYVIASIKEDVKLERKHRRQLEAANTKLMNELAEAKLSVKQYAQNYEMERKARELMEEACDELTKEVEEDQAEVELLRRECQSMREEIEEERRMLQMAEVWREERVQMKLSDAKLMLEHKYAQLNKLQAEMESFFRKDGKNDGDHSALREARMLREAASTIRIHNVKEFNHENSYAPEDVDLVFEQFRQRKHPNGTYSPASPASNLHSVSPATDIFLERVDERYASGLLDVENDDGLETPYHAGNRGSCTWVGTSNPSAARVYKVSNASVSDGKGWDDSEITEVQSGERRRSGKNGALIRRLWRSATSESSKKAGSARSRNQRNGCSPGATPSSEKRSTVITATSPVAKQCSSSDSVNPEKTRGPKGCDGLPRGGMQKQSLKEKLLEARMDDHKEKPRHGIKQNI